jgi:sulfur relay (sulfurtransferase) DsrF/TusC family protein
MKVLNIIHTAYRATLEEQDDPVVWLTHTLKGAGAEVDVLLRGNAVHYAVQDQDPAGLSFGDKRQTQPPRLADDISSFVGKGLKVFVLEEDAAERGLERGELVSGLTPVSRSGLPEIMAGYDQVWQW